MYQSAVVAGRSCDVRAEVRVAMRCEVAGVNDEAKRLSVGVAEILTGLAARKRIRDHVCGCSMSGGDRKHDFGLPSRQLFFHLIIP